MKKQEGITLISLVAYIAVAMIVIGVMAVVSSYFYKNIDWVKDREKHAQEFNKFNMFFIQDVKNNKNVTVSGNNIKFEDGTEYIFNLDQKAIYRNGKAIAKNVQAAVFTTTTETIRNTTKNIVNVSIAIGNTGALFTKEIDYVLKYW